MSRLSATTARMKLWVRFFAKIAYPRDLPLVLHAFSKRSRFLISSDTWAIVESVGGFLSRKEAGLLHCVAYAWPVAGPVLELGAYEGRSTIVFASAGRQVHAVDAWSLSVNDLSAYGDQASADTVFERFLENLRRAGVESRVRPQRGLTHDVARRWNIPGAILFVDAGHTYADVKGDLELWAPHLIPGGVLLMHDVLGDAYLDVTRAASDLLRDSWQVIASAGSIVAFTRREPQA